MPEPTFFINFVISAFEAIRADGPAFFEGLLPLLPAVKGVLSFLSILFITGIIYSLVRIWEIRREEDEQFHFAEPTDNPITHERKKWDVVEKHLDSTSHSDWRVAIIEADNILEEIVNQLGYTGETLGEKLKQVDRSDIRTIQSAWEAHKVRNKIAHEGSAFELTHEEARRVIGLYEQVFKELQYL